MTRVRSFAAVAPPVWVLVADERRLNRAETSCPGTGVRCVCRGSASTPTVTSLTTVRIRRALGGYPEGRSLS